MGPSKVAGAQRRLFRPLRESVTLVRRREPSERASRIVEVAPGVVRCGSAQRQIGGAGRIGSSLLVDGGQPLIDRRPLMRPALGRLRERGPVLGIPLTIQSHQRGAIGASFAAGSHLTRCFPARLGEGGLQAFDERAPGPVVERGVGHAHEVAVDGDRPLQAMDDREDVTPRV